MSDIKFIDFINPRRMFSAMDAHMSEALSGAAIAFLLRGVGAGLAFILNVVIARLLGADGAGLYFIAMSVTVIGSIIARMGLDNSLLRFIASSATQGDWGRVKGVFALGMKKALIATMTTSLLLAFLTPLLAEKMFGKPDVSEPMRWMSMGIITFSFMMLLAESLKGLKQIRNSMLVSGAIYPLVSLIIIWPLVSFLGVAGASLAYVLATGMAALVGLMFWRRNMCHHEPTNISFDPEDLKSSSRPLWLMAFINQAVLPWTPLLLLGVWGTSGESGIFGAATRVAMLVTFFLATVNTILAPKFAELHAKGDIKTLGHLARRFAMYITLATSPLFLLLIIKGQWVMGMFGDDFLVGGGVLAILAVGQVINSITGSVGYLLMMTGHERDMRNSSIIGSVIMLFLAFTLIPSMGMTGAAISSASAIAGMNIVSSYMVWERLGVVVVPFLVVKR